MESTEVVSNSKPNGVGFTSAKFLEDIVMAPADPIFGITARFRADPTPNKVDLIIGAYRDEHGRPWVLPSVRAAEERILQQNLNHEYLPMEGLAAFREGAAAVLFGANNPCLTRTTTVQSISGTGALLLGASFLSKFYKNHPVLISNPTWANHYNIFEEHGIQVTKYRYFDQATHSFDFNNMIADITAAPNGSIILLHACAHNPTGADPTLEQWGVISDVCKAKNFIVFFDSAYQGFATGDLDRDARAIRMFVEQGHNIMVSQSFAKNMGLYGERAGALHVVAPTPVTCPQILSQLQRIIRMEYSNPPSYGGRIAAMIMKEPELTKMWHQDIITMSSRITEMRQALYNGLKKRNTPGNWEHIITQIGMFTFTGLTPVQCENLISKHHVYLTMNGRISVAGLNPSNVDHVAEGIHQVVIDSNLHQKL